MIPDDVAIVQMKRDQARDKWMGQLATISDVVQVKDDISAMLEKERATMMEQLSQDMAIRAAAIVDEMVSKRMAEAASMSIVNNHQSTLGGFGSIWQN